MDTPTDGTTGTKPNIPDQALLSSNISLLKKALRTCADSSKSILELGDNIDLSNTDLATIIYWPDINKDLAAIFKLLQNEELYSNIIDALEIHFENIDKDLLKQYFDSVLRTCEKIQDLVDGNTPGQYPLLPNEETKRKIFVERIKSFAEEYLDEYNSLAKYTDNYRGENFPWLTKVSPTITIDSPFL